MRSPVKFENIIFEEKSLHVPELDEIVQVLQSALSRNFQEVTVEIVDCPNLTAEPYSLVCEGLNGSLTLMELGGFATLLPLEDKGKVYDIVETSRKIMKGKDLAIIGTGAGPVSLEKSNCEIILNMNIPLKGNLENKSMAIRINEDDEEISLDPINDQQIFSYLVNLFLCEGKSGKVVRVHCKKRIGPLSYVESIRMALLQHYEENCVGLAGTFLMKQGHFIHHLNNPKDLNYFQYNLQKFEMSAPLNAVGTLFSIPNRMNLRVEHFHSFSFKNVGGHYYYDTTPEIVEYEGFFSVAEKVVKGDINKYGY